MSVKTAEVTGLGKFGTAIFESAKGRGKLPKPAGTHHKRTGAGWFLAKLPTITLLSTLLEVRDVNHKINPSRV